MAEANYESADWAAFSKEGLFLCHVVLPRVHLSGVKGSTSKMTHSHILQGVVLAVHWKLSQGQGLGTSVLLHLGLSMGGTL